MISKVSPFLAKVRTLFLAVVSISLVGGSVATDYIFRHEIRRQARKELEARGLQANVSGIVKAVRENKLDLFPNYDTAGINFGRADKDGVTPLYAAIEEDNAKAIEEMFQRANQVRKTVDRPSGLQGLTPLKMALNDANYPLAQRLIDELGADINAEKDPGLPYLIDAANRDDNAMRDFLLKNGVDVNEKGSQPHSVLTLAAGEDDLELMDRLVSHGAKINVTGVTGKPLLIESALQDEYGEMEFLLKHGAKVDVIDDGDNPLNIALRKQDSRMRGLLLDHGAEVDRIGSGGEPLIFEALERGDHDWFLTLLESGVSVDTKNSAGDSLFLDAVKHNDYQMIDFLIEQGADVNARDKDGRSAFEMAILSGDTALARTLMIKKADYDGEAMFATAYRRRDIPTMMLLLNGGVDANSALPGAGKRIMDVAVEESAAETVRTLLDAGADIGNNMWAALLTGQDDLVEVILNNGGDPKQRGPSGQDALSYVLNTGRFNLLSPLLEAGANPNPMYDHAESWMSRAIRTGDEETAEALIKAGAEIGDGIARDGHSLLGWSVAHEMEDVALALIDAGVDVNVVEPTPARSEFIEEFDESTTFRRALRYDRRVRPLMMAAVKRNHRIAQAMVNAGAKNHFTSKYLYPVGIAAWYSDVRMMQIIFGRNPDYQPRKIVIDLSRQRVTLYTNGKATYSSTCSTGRSGYRTPTGTYAITQKHKNHVSSIYGSAMPYFMRLSCRDFGLHQGHCPGYPASHGCIRLPWSTAKHLYYKCSLGDMVVIQR